MRIVDELLPPCSYQGGKQRLSYQICSIIEEYENFEDFVFYDLCCGCGAVSLEMINRGYSTVMIDKGPYGAFWESIGTENFSLEILREEIDKLPNMEDIGSYLKELSNKKVDSDLFV